jgi:hypothetical protein
VRGWFSEVGGIEAWIITSNIPRFGLIGYKILIRCNKLPGYPQTNITMENHPFMAKSC